MEDMEHTSTAESNETSEELTVSDEQIDEALGARSERPLRLHDPSEKGLKDVEGGFNIGIVSISLVPLELLNKKIKVVVRLCGFSVGEFILTEGEFEQTIGPNIGIAKANVTVAADWAESRIRYACKACVRNFIGKWKCKSSDGVLANW